MNRIELIDKCIKKVEEKLEWGDSSQWQNTHFQKLSELFLDKHQVQISPSTFKRLWGRLPSNQSFRYTTLDELARFIGYRDWMDFEVHTVKKHVAPSWAGLFSKKQVWYLVITILILSVTGIGASLYSKWFDKLPDVILEVKEDGDALYAPGLAKVYYQVPEKHDYSIRSGLKRTIEQSPMVELKNCSGVYHVMLKSPKPVCVQLFQGENVVKGLTINPVTKGWIGLLDFEGEDELFLPEDAILRNGLLQFSLENISFDPSLKPFILNYYNHKKIEISGTSFVLESVFHYTNSILFYECNEISINIACENGYITVPFAASKCLPRIVLVVGDHAYPGKTNDLSGFAIAEGERVKIRVEYANGSFVVQKNEEVIFKHEISSDLGKIIGVRYWINGIGEIERTCLYPPRDTLNCHFMHQ